MVYESRPVVATPRTTAPAGTSTSLTMAPAGHTASLDPTSMPFSVVTTVMVAGSPAARVPRAVAHSG